MKLSAPASLKWIAALGVAGWGNMPGIIQTLAILTAIDYASGFACAWSRKELSSDIGRRGLVKKGMTFLLLFALHFAQQRTGLGLRLDEGLALAYVVNELVSIIENCARAGVPIPAAVVSALLSVQKLRMQQASAEQLAALEKDQGPA